MTTNPAWATQSGSNTDPNQKTFDEVIIESPTSSTSLAASGTATQEVLDKAITHIIRTKNLSDNPTTRNNIIIAITELVQIGATSPKFAETRINSYGPIKISVKELREACKVANTTLRKIARRLQGEAIKVATKLDIPGNLSKSYVLENPDASREELYWVSDFQTFSNDSAMPAEVKNFLLKNYQKRFTK